MGKGFRRFIMVLFALIPVIGIMADDTSLVVWTRTGTIVGYALDKKPVITFTDSEMKISGEGIDAVYELNNFLRYTYEEGNFSGLKDIRLEGSLAKIDGESIFFPSVKANSTVGIFTLDGVQIFKKTVHEDGKYAFPLSALRAGIYLVNVNGLTFKIVKK